MDGSDLKPKSNTIGVEITSNPIADDTQVNLGPHSSLKSVKISDPKNPNDSVFDNGDIIKKEISNLDESTRYVSHPVSAISKYSEQVYA